MTAFKVLYIDEDQKAVNSLIRLLSSDFEVVSPEFSAESPPSFDEIMVYIYENDFDFLIVDYHLHEKTNCGFDGDDILKAFLARFPNDLGILFTNHAANAIDSTEGINPEKIHSKSELTDDSFKKRIQRQIKDYVQRKKDSEIRLEELLEKEKQEDLSAEEEAELNNLDDFLDKVNGTEGSNIPEQLKGSSNAKKVGELISKTDELISKLNTL